MLNVCPVCDGEKKLEYYTKHWYGKRLVKSGCWACRGTGQKEFQGSNDVTESRIDEMYESLGVEYGK